MDNTFMVENHYRIGLRLGLSVAEALMATANRYLVADSND